MTSGALPQRKSLWLKDYDYAQAGVYFLTVCTLQKRPTLAPTKAVADAATGRLIGTIKSLAANPYRSRCKQKGIHMGPLGTEGITTTSSADRRTTFASGHTLTTTRPIG